MCEILFRGKRIDNGEWVYGWYQPETTITHYDGRVETIGVTIAYKTEDGSLDDVLVDPETVGQYTGLTDKNGKRIFEGDVVVATNRRRLSSKPSVVEFSPCSGYWNCAEKREPVVIGNVVDNPELL